MREGRGECRVPVSSEYDEMAPDYERVMLRAQAGPIKLTPYPPNCRPPWRAPHLKLTDYPGFRAARAAPLAQVKGRGVQFRFRANRTLAYPGGSGIDSLRQILLASRFAISEWRGIASACPVWGFSHKLCSLPSLRTTQPCRRRCRRRPSRFIRRSQVPAWHPAVSSATIPLACAPE